MSCKPTVKLLVLPTEVLSSNGFKRAADTCKKSSRPHCAQQTCTAKTWQQHNGKPEASNSQLTASPPQPGLLQQQQPASC
jgi:hypothetical protein